MSTCNTTGSEGGCHYVKMRAIANSRLSHLTKSAYVVIGDVRFIHYFSSPCCLLVDPIADKTTDQIIMKGIKY